MIQSLRSLLYVREQFGSWALGLWSVLVAHGGLFETESNQLLSGSIRRFLFDGPHRPVPVTDRHSPFKAIFK